MRNAKKAGMRKNSRISRLKSRILPVLRKNGIAKAGLFGSAARGEEKRGSDIDILIEFKGRKSLLDLASIEMKLEKALKKRVDLLTYKSISPLLKDRILKEEVRIL